MRFNGKMALVTGAASGIGRAVAIRLAEEGADIAIHDRNETGAAETLARVADLGRKARFYCVDISQSQSVQAAIADTQADFGHVDILVNAAAINVYKKYHEVDDDEWSTMIGVNLSGSWYYCRYLAPRMVALGSGSIVNFASIGVTSASYWRVPYMASKGGIAGLTKSLALDLAESNVRVNAVGPGPTETGMTRSSERRFGSVTPEMVKALVPLRRWIEPREQANAVLFLASDEASGITGQILYVDGGLTAGNQIGAAWRPVLDDEAQVSLG